MPKATPSPAASPAKKRKPRTPKNAFALPVRAPDARPIPDFAPVPRVYNRHDGWTPERQRAFIGALADTGCVDRAAQMVNMAQTNCYTLRRAKGAEGFAKAWDAALGQGVKRLKDIAFQRAIEGTLEPVIAGGKLIGHKRKFNDALLMFCLRHYGEDGEGRRTTINYFSSRASAGASAGAASVASGPSSGSGRAEGGGAAEAHASATTVRTVKTGTGAPREKGEADALLRAFEGVPLDETAQAEIMAALHAAAARARAEDAELEAGGERAAEAMEADPATAFIAHPANALPWRGNLVDPWQMEYGEAPEGEDVWTQLGEPWPDWAQALEGDIVARER